MSILQNFQSMLKIARWSFTWRTIFLNSFIKLLTGDVIEEILTIIGSNILIAIVTAE